VRNAIQWCSEARELCGFAIDLCSNVAELCVMLYSGAVRLENCVVSL
jgi:hypothetical protein